MTSRRVMQYLALVLIWGSLLLVSPLLHADAGQLDSFSAWCIPGKGAKYWYGETKNRITSDEWSELDGTGFTGGAYVFRHSGGNEVMLGQRRLPILARNGAVMIVTELDDSPRHVRVNSFMIHTGLRKIIRLHAESFEYPPESRSSLSSQATVMDCDWRK